MALTRTLHWDTRFLGPHLLSNERTPFVWGSWDCALFAALAIQSFTGTMIADDFYPNKYRDEASAFALIKTVTGGTTVADAAAYCARKHGLAEWTKKGGTPAPLFAKRGDLVVVQNGGTLIAGVVDLNGRHAITVNEKGLVRLPIAAVTRAWAI